MNHSRLLPVTLAVISSLFLVFPQAAYAAVDVGTFQRAVYPHYIDPGTGSLIIQMVIGAVAAGLAMMGIYRAKVKNFLCRVFTRRRNEEDGR